MTQVKDINPELLVEDMDLYPRSHVDESHVNDLMRAVKAGEFLPPPIADEKSKRLVDGVHRTRAYIKAGVEKIPVEFRRYRSKASMLKDAVALNAAHGRKLDQRDRTRSILLLEAVGVKENEIARTLHTTTERVVKLRQRVVEVNGEGPLPAKPAYWARKDEKPRKIKRSQVALVEAAPGWRHIQSVKHLTNDLNSGLIDLEDEKLVEALGELRQAIDSAL